MVPIEDLIRPVMEQTYGLSRWTDSAIAHIASVIELHYESSDRERRVMLALWDWFAGGGTAAATAAQIEELLR